MVTNPETPSLRSELRSFGEEIFLADASRCCRLANQDTELTRKHTTVDQHNQLPEIARAQIKQMSKSHALQL